MYCNLCKKKDENVLISCFVCFVYQIPSTFYDMVLNMCYEYTLTLTDVLDRFETFHYFIFVLAHQSTMYLLGALRILCCPSERVCVRP